MVSGLIQHKKVVKSVAGKSKTSVTRKPRKGKVGKRNPLDRFLNLKSKSKKGKRK